MANSSILNSHKVRRSYRRLIVVFLTTVYMLTVMTPFVPLILHSDRAAHAITGECAGDCRICGCSPAASTNRTCCCAKKKLIHSSELGTVADTCIIPKLAATEQTKEYYAKSSPSPPETSEPDCCKKKTVEKKTIIIACGCPCGNGKHAALSVSDTSEVLPFHFTEQFSTPHIDVTYTNQTHRLTSRHGEPPEPPPQISRVS